MTGVFPKLWKQAKVFPIFKDGKRSDMNNYRPISILSILSKVIESHVHDSFYVFLSSFDLISKHQSGFRKHHSCETGLAALLSHWHEQIDNNKLIGCINIDLRKAFDILNHNILCEKLKIYKCSEVTVSWFRSYLSNRWQAVYLEDSQSKMLPIIHGIPQGSILGPLLFIMFVNDLPLCLMHSFIHMYADDTSFYVTGKNLNELNTLINSDLENVSRWFALNHLVINASKTNCMLVCTQQKHVRLGNVNLNVSINESLIQNVEHQNILGITIDNCLKFQLHVDNICKKLAKLCYLFTQVQNCLTYEGKHAFYNSYVLPCLDYCVTTWGYSSKTNLDKLYRYQKRIGRLILNDSECNSDVLFARLGWLSIYERIDFLTAKLVYKCLFDEAPESLKCLFSIRENRSLRNAGIDLSLPFPKHEFRKKCFEYAGAKIWNSLPTAVRTANNVDIFKMTVKNHIISLRPILHG